jgi:hypothetical protein
MDGLITNALSNLLLNSYEPPSAFCATLLSAILTARKLFLRYLSPPRPDFLRYASFTEEPDENDRFFLTQWEAAPYYVKPTFWNRWVRWHG